MIKKEMYDPEPRGDFMYTQQDYLRTSRSTKIRVWLGIALVAVFAAGVIVCTVLKLKTAQMAVAGVGFIVCWFVWDMKIVPWIRYNRFMKDLKGGQRRTTKCRFVDVSGETRLFDGVEVYDVTVSVKEDDDSVTDNDEDKRLFVLDADKTLPALEPGDGLCVTSFGNFITDIQKA